LGHSFQTLQPLLKTSLRFKRQQANNYNQLIEERKSMGEQFEKTLRHLENQVKHVTEEKKRSDEKSENTTEKHCSNDLTN